jgi:hypothetical protein
MKNATTSGLAGVFLLSVLGALHASPSTDIDKGIHRVAQPPDAGRCSDAHRGDVGSQRAVDLFSLSAALFVENRGQWEPSVRYVHDGGSVDVAVTDSRIRFQARQDSASLAEWQRDPRCATDANARSLQVLSFLRRRRGGPAGGAEAVAEPVQLLRRRANPLAAECALLRDGRLRRTVRGRRLVCL